MKKDELDLHILTYLSITSDGYGYDFNKWLKCVVDATCSMGEIYREMHWLAEEGFIDRSPPTGARKKIVYNINAHGRELLGCVSNNLEEMIKRISRCLKHAHQPVEKKNVI